MLRPIILWRFKKWTLNRSKENPYAPNDDVIYEFETIHHGNTENKQSFYCSYRTFSG